MCFGQPQTQGKAKPPLQAPSRGWIPAQGKGLRADLSFLLSQQVNKSPQQLPELFAALSTVFPSFPPTTTTKPALLVNPPPHFTLPKQSPAATQSPPSPSSRKSTERKAQAGTEMMMNRFSCFTRPSVAPCCPIPRPGRAYPRTSLLFWANQTQPGYTLTADKAVLPRWVLSYVLAGDPWPLTCSQLILQPCQALPCCA